MALGKVLCTEQEISSIHPGEVGDLVGDLGRQDRMLSLTFSCSAELGTLILGYRWLKRVRKNVKLQA